MRILLIEDDNGINIALSHALKSNYTLDVVTNASAGLLKIELYDYNLIILDLNLPDMPGLDVCNEIRRHNITTPILILTAEARVMSKVKLLDAGADDYLTKPFSLGELKARLRVLIRHSDVSTPKSKRLVADDLVLDCAKHRVERAGKLIRLRRKEFAMLECLMQNAGHVVTRNILGHHAWRENEDPWTNTIDVHIKYLRDKIDRPFDKPLIKTVHGLGYKLETSRSVAKLH